MSDIADRYAGLAGGFLARITATPTRRWEAPSPCRDWTAHDVVAHVINGHRGILSFVYGTPPVAADGVGVAAMSDAPVVAPGTDLAARRMPGGPLGKAPVAEAADLIGALELLGHTWDLARATGGDEVLDQDAVTRTHEALLPYHDNLLATGAFDESIPAPAGADAQTAFLCFTGRRP